MGRFLAACLISVCLVIASAWAEPEKRTQLSQRPSAQDLEVIAMLELLQMMDLAEEMEMVKAMDYLVEDRRDEHKSD